MSILTTHNESISLIRSDSKLGVDFDSPETLANYLAYVKSLADPSLRHFVPVLENDGIIPRDDDNFQALLKRMGIMDWDIPNNLRGHFLAKFLGRHDMKIEGWEILPAETKKEFVRYLRHYYSRQLFQKDSNPISQELIDNIILPILEAEDPEANGNIPENWDFVRHLGAIWSHSNYSLKVLMQNLLYEFLNDNIGSHQAAALTGLKQREIQDLARRHKWLFCKNSRGHWQFTRHTIMGFARR